MNVIESRSTELSNWISYSLILEKDIKGLLNSWGSSILSSVHRLVIVWFYVIVILYFLGHFIYILISLAFIGSKIWWHHLIWKMFLDFTVTKVSICQEPKPLKQHKINLTLTTFATTIITTLTTTNINTFSGRSGKQWIWVEKLIFPISVTQKA